MKQFTTSILLTIALLIGIISCNKSTNNLTISNGTYKGTFQRQISGIGNISKVSFIFNAGNWTGQSNTPKYPALCSGSFNINTANEIIFFDSCIWTADFDWTLILNQKYTILISGNSYVLTKDYGNGTKDIYTLSK